MIVSSKNKKLVTCYNVKSPLKNLALIKELTTLYLNEMSENFTEIKTLTIMDKLRHGPRDCVLEKGRTVDPAELRTTHLTHLTL